MPKTLLDLHFGFHPSMASGLTSRPLLVIFLLFLSSLPLPTLSSTNSSTVQVALCRSTPFPAACLDSIKLSISINISPSVLSLAIRTLQAAITEAAKLSSLLSSTTLIESQRGSLKDCRDLHQITLAVLRRSVALLTPEPRKLADARAYLSAALTNRATCLEGLAGASGSSKAPLLNSLNAAYAHVSNSLSLVARSAGGRKGRRRLSRGRRRGFPAWVGRKGRRLLQSGEYGEFDPGSVVTVAADGSGNFTSVTEAVAWAPSNYDNRVIILVRAGVYEENVEITSDKTNIVFIGDGSDVTVIRGSRSVDDGWTTFRSATVAVSGDGFLARDITFQNTAGPAKGQAVALRINADLVALYRCAIDGFQDTLYVHSFRQFYRECDISGTVDFIFGNAAVVFQACNLFAKQPLPGQFNAITAQSKDDPNEDTGISIDNCSVVASPELASSNFKVRTYLGRPWKVYSTVVYIESYLDELVDPAGWTKWSGEQAEQGLDTVYYGEYMNTGQGAATDGRVTWPGYHLMDYYDASSFSVSEFIYGDEWLDSTSFPYDGGI